MSQESRDFAGEMYGLEDQLSKDDFNIWEEKTGKI
jgi:hypothetical protein